MMQDAMGFSAKFSHIISAHYKAWCRLHWVPVIECASLFRRFFHFGRHKWHPRSAQCSICARSLDMFVQYVPNLMLAGQSAKHDTIKTYIGFKTNPCLPVHFEDRVQMLLHPTEECVDFWVMLVRLQFAAFDHPTIVRPCFQRSFHIPVNECSLKKNYPRLLSVRHTNGSDAMKSWTFAILAAAIISSILTSRVLSP